jgi:GDP-L-fucose synthase
LYGPNDNFDEVTSHVPAALMARLHQAKLNGMANVEIWGTGASFREFMHVDDLADACWFFLERKCRGQHINIGSGQEISIRNFAYLMAKTIGYEGEIYFDPTKPSGTPRKLLDLSFANSAGWRASIRLENGLSLTYDWFKTALENGDVRGL